MDSSLRIYRDAFDESLGFVIGWLVLGGYFTLTLFCGVKCSWRPLPEANCGRESLNLESHHIPRVAPEANPT